MSSEHSNQIIYSGGNEPLSYTILLPNQRAYLIDENSFVTACENADLEVIKYFLKCGAKFNCQNGFIAASKKNLINICKELINSIEIDENLIKMSLQNDNVEIFDLIFNKILPENREYFVNKAFFISVMKQFNQILEYIYIKGYFWNISNDCSIFEICLIEYKYKFNQTDEEYDYKKKKIIETYNWLENHGAFIKSKHIQNMMHMMTDPISAKLILESFNKSKENQDANYQVILIDQINKKIIELVNDNNKEIIDEFLKFGIEINLFFKNYLKSFDTKNFDLLFFLLEKGAYLEEKNFDELIVKILRNSWIEQLKMFLTKLNINLTVYSTKFVKKILDIAIASSDLVINQYLHSLVNYKNYYPSNSSNSTISSIYKFLNTNSDKTVSDNIFENIHSNKDAEKIMYWLISLEYIINKESYCNKITNALLCENTAYIKFGLNTGLITETFLKNKVENNSYLKKFINNLIDKRNKL